MFSKKVYTISEFHFVFASHGQKPISPYATQTKNTLVWYKGEGREGISPTIQKTNDCIQKKE